MVARRVPAASLALAALLGAGFAFLTNRNGPAVPPEVPLPGDGWGVESVMLLDPQPPATYALGPPFRVTRAGEVVLQRQCGPDEVGRYPLLLRIDLTVRGEPATLFLRAKFGPVDEPGPAKEIAGHPGG